MAKTNRATRKELETVIEKIIEELHILRRGFAVLDNYLGAYVKFKGDTLTFNDFLKTEAEKMDEADKKAKVKTENPKTKDVKSAKKSRYSKVNTPPL